MTKLTTSALGIVFVALSTIVLEQEIYSTQLNSNFCVFSKSVRELCLQR